MKSTDYPILLAWSEDNNAYIGKVVGLPGCKADGPTIEKAIAHTGIAIREWIDMARDLGNPVPEPMKFEEIQHELDAQCERVRNGTKNIPEEVDQAFRESFSEKEIDLDSAMDEKAFSPFEIIRRIEKLEQHIAKESKLEQIRKIRSNPPYRPSSEAYAQKARAAEASAAFANAIPIPSTSAEWLRIPEIQKLFGLKRSMIFSLLSSGQIKSKSLKKRGNVKGIRLVNVESVRVFIESLEE